MDNNNLIVENKKDNLYNKKKISIGDNEEVPQYVIDLFIKLEKEEKI